MKSPKDYYSMHMVVYERDKTSSRVWNSIPVLEFLKGRVWDEISLAYVTAMRPSSIRVTRGECTCDSWPWRVTVTVNSDDVIERISQEVEFEVCPSGVIGRHSRLKICRVSVRVRVPSRVPECWGMVKWYHNGF